MTAIALVAYLIALIIPLVALWLIYRQDLYGTGSFKFVLSSIVWGVISFFIAAQINNITVSQGWVSYENFQRFSAPVVEEILKALLLLYLIRRADFSYFVDGAIYGFAAGVGFAVIENFSYIAGLGANQALGVAVARVISTNLMHATASAVVGITLGYTRNQQTKRSRINMLLMVLAGWLFAMAIHVGFNNLVTRVVSTLLLLYAAAVGIGGTGFIAFVIKRGLNDAKEWIGNLGASDRITHSERIAAQNFNEIEKMLEFMIPMFGQHKVDQIERFVRLQGQLGIKKNTLQSVNDERLREEIQSQIDELTQEIDESRREVGSYAMMTVRSIFPNEDIQTYMSLQQQIEEQRTKGTAKSGTGVWDTIGSRSLNISQEDVQADQGKQG
jgi:RsiW-degrading membrane proteinase PrsW (M82 family)